MFKLLLLYLKDLLSDFFLHAGIQWRPQKIFIVGGVTWIQLPKEKPHEHNFIFICK